MRKYYGLTVLLHLIEILIWKFRLIDIAYIHRNHPREGNKPIIYEIHTILYMEL